MPTNRPNTPTVNKRQDPASIIDRLVSFFPDENNLCYVLALNFNY